MHMQVIVQQSKCSHHWIASEATTVVQFHNLHNYLLQPRLDADISQENVDAANAACQKSMNTNSGEDRIAAGSKDPWVILNPTLWCRASADLPQNRIRAAVSIAWCRVKTVRSQWSCSHFKPPILLLLLGFACSHQLLLLLSCWRISVAEVAEDC